MTIQETGETLILWINSCKTQEQLNLIKTDLVQRYIVDRFTSVTDIMHMALILDGIEEALEIKNKKLVENGSDTEAVHEEQIKKRTDSL